MTRIVDRRERASDGSAESRRRFVERNRKHIEKAIERAITGGNITDIGRDGVDVTIPRDDISEPFIHHADGGIQRRVYAGNKDYAAGDHIPRPEDGRGGQGDKDPGNNGEQEDDFVFHASEEEFLNIFMENCALPNMTKKSADSAHMTETVQNGFTTQGSFNNADLIRSTMRKIARTSGAAKPFEEKIITLLEEQQDIFVRYGAEKINPPSLIEQSRRQKIVRLEGAMPGLKLQFNAAVLGRDAERMTEIEAELAVLHQKRKHASRWNESTDLKFRDFTEQPVPSSQAVMFAMMDVSGSMSEERKNNAKTFYFLLYHFLKRHYRKVDVVWIRHTSEAEEVNEAEFFYSKDSGGTVVSTALKKMKEIVEERYPTGEWNIYGAQASDGENWGGDTPKCLALIREMMAYTQGYFYTEVTNEKPQELWQAYQPLIEEFKGKFFTGRIRERKDVGPVFHEFFRKRDGTGAAPQNRPAAFGPGGP